MTTAERKRALTPVPCPACGHSMPAGRTFPSMRTLTGGVCGMCSREQRREARVEAPMYETEAWARGVQL